MDIYTKHQKDYICKKKSVFLNASFNLQITVVQCWRLWDQLALDQYITLMSDVVISLVATDIRLSHLVAKPFLEGWKECTHLTIDSPQN